MESKPLHPENADSPILVKLLGNTMETKPLHPENADSPILVKLLGNTMEDKDSLF